MFKTKLNISLISVLLLFFYPSFVYAQIEEEVRDTIFSYEETQDIYYTKIPKVKLVEIGVLTGLPQKAFNRFHPRTIWGGYAGFHLQYKVDSPLFIGGSVGYYAIDNFRSKVERIFDSFTEVWDGSTTSNLIDINISVRYFLDLRFWILEPYIEPSLGLNWFFTNTTFLFPDTEESDFSNNTSSFTLNYGGCLGLMFYLSGEFYLNASVGYYPGLATSYYLFNQEKKDVLYSTFEAFDRAHSATDLMRFKLGVTYAF